MIVKLLSNILELITVLCLSAGLFSFHPGSDTLTMKAVGSNNKIAIDSLLHPVNGEIIQTGEKNRIEINTGDSTAKNKAKQNIIIKQAGSNNSVKINSK